MPVNLNLRTGDPSPERQFIEWQFVKLDNGQVSLCFGNRRATLEPHQWVTFVEVVKQLSPSKWRSNRPIPELAGNEPAREILRGCEDTPRFQLLLAGVDIVHAFRIMENPPVTDMLREFESRNHTIRSIFGPGSIYFVPSLILREATERALYELLAQNKLGQASLTAEDRANVYDPIRYYIPYAVPITLEREMLPEANRLWDVVRTEYYAFRERLPALSE